MLSPTAAQLAAPAPLPMLGAAPRGHGLWYPAFYSIQLLSNVSARGGSPGADEVMRFTSIGSLALTVGLIGVSWNGCTRDEAGERATDRARLVAAMGERRALAARITGGFPHAPCRGTQRVVCTPDPELGPLSPSDRLRTLVEIERSSTPLETALAGLLTSPGDPRWVDRAVRELEAAGAHGSKAEVLSDLAAAYLVRSEVRDDPRDLLRAATAALSAVAAGPVLPEARFNLALVLERLAVPGEERSAWRAYLETEARPGWRSEGEERLRRVAEAVAPVSDAACREVRDRALDRLIPAWAEHLRAGRTTAAAAALAKAREAGERLAPTPGDGGAGDPLVRQVVEEIAAAPLARRERLVGAWLAIGRGAELYAAGDYGGADRDLARAELELGESPAAGWVRLGRARCAYQQGRYQEALQFLEGLAGVRGGRFPSLAGQAWWIRGTISVLEDRPADAYAAYRRSVSAFDRAGDRGSQLSVELRWIAALATQGAHDEAWRRRFRLLREAPAILSTKELRVVYIEAGHAALLAGYPAVALVFLGEAVRHLGPAGDPTDETALRRWRAEALRRLGRPREAEQELARARALLPEIPDPEHRSVVRSEVEVLEGRLLESSHPRDAVAPLSEAIDRFVRTGLLNPLPRAYLGRARAYRRLGRNDAAASDLRAAVDLIESRRAHAGSAADRAMFLADVREVYEEAVDLAARTGDVEHAFRLAEALHARVLDDALGRGADAEESAVGPVPETVPSAEIQDQISLGESLWAFLALPDRLLRWRLDRESLELDTVPVSATELERHVGRLRAAARTGDPAALEEASRVLSAWVLGSSTPLPGRLLVVPDGPLHDLPLDLLVDPSTGSPLVESSVVALEPSGSVFARIAARDRRRPSLNASSALVVADPAFPRDRFPGLPRLPGARSEGVAVRELYPNSTVLAGAAASASAFLEALGRHPVAHVAAHAVPSSGDPRLSYLVLSEGPLYAREIAERRLGDARVIVLSTCGSGREGERLGEGLAGLSQAFLVAGASSVVGTLWPIEDRAVVPLATAFHRNLVAGADPASALRKAKLEALRAGDPPSVWAAFELIGASAPGGGNS